MKSTIASLLLLAIIGAASAQFDAVPECARACVERAITASGCAITEINCMCTSAPFINTMVQCVQTTCGGREQMATFANQLCTACGSPACLGASAVPNITQA
ncbi:uncharacterized protein SPPG_08924 [Spizellomyces punctatus DAOM BR117]|uniref:CFEM domain-containing protein n=1 Tax=Spizellomyces punctatus (strain DAOM BR117) TaxID=645134 RepID=A0A0L0HR51_SPIPD|nr:uncharacterized protein SPPG_08924 [Spizellomyces punctatus DAOM BR117]KND03851.1 hypothetical protein SPPG_08924 [Spizellomyces punctatus DAOM BR117]|eukprot:XP_016611890.1 hypothetical protein SPPG_08924 [Spizellomyces punctatus DAOM BR117]